MDVATRKTRGRCAKTGIAASRFRTSVTCYSQLANDGINSEVVSSILNKGVYFKYCIVGWAIPDVFSKSMANHRNPGIVKLFRLQPYKHLTLYFCAFVLVTVSYFMSYVD